MKTNLTLFTKIATRSAAAWLSIVIPGILVSIIGLIISIYLLGHQPGPGYAGSRAGIVGAILGIVVMFTVAFWSSVLFVLSLSGFALFPSMASGYTLKKAIFLVWDNKLGDYFMEKIGVYVDKVMVKIAEKRATLDATLNKEVIKELKLEVKKDGDTNKWQKKILNYLLKKVNLDNIDWKGDPAAVKKAILVKVKEYIGEKLMPSALYVRLMLILPIVLMVLAFIYDRH
ncbi:hypothetical protein [Chitinophaga sancti]|uniref:Uncharacterized protein n=1 Tax=Chitinophaga sancti TaxID=1004 RepID=A0A1K1QYA8_9BACT|nr:hypothetical protein [Chitinophaga sancti]WQD62081.1 hypothetical protein U0033_29770 [Chitinophaga sancti]WQG92350.1 hypothetical protein SR876_12615 [Chitinophaga sancti]SFW64887.1 hypothetical protein SAMN05661012_03218 [Chitinophaga sancti]